MPIDVQLTFKDSTKEMHYVPLDLMYGEKPEETDSIAKKGIRTLALDKSNLYYSNRPKVDRYRRR